MDMDVTRQVADLAVRTASDQDAVAGEPADGEYWGAVLGQRAPVPVILEEG